MAWASQGEWGTFQKYMPFNNETLTWVIIFRALPANVPLPPQEETVMCTLANGNRVYLPLAAAGHAPLAVQAAQPAGLLAVPVAHLRLEVDRARLARAEARGAAEAGAQRINQGEALAPGAAALLLSEFAGAEAETKRLQAALHGSIEGPLNGQTRTKEADDDEAGGSGKGAAESDDDDEKEEENEAETAAAVPRPNKVSAAPAAANGGAHGTGELWVQKYAPRHFSELLSAEALNRGVLHAIKV